MKTDIEAYRKAFLSRAFGDENTLGRRYPFPDTCINKNAPPFFLDQNTICASELFRRLSLRSTCFPLFSTALAFSPPPWHTGVHSHRDRSLATADFAKNFCAFIGLNQQLAAAVSLGSHFGSPAMGRFGEKFMTDLTRAHLYNPYVAGAILADKISEAGSPLNLSFEVLRGIHVAIGKGVTFATLPLEYSVSYVARQIAEIFYDIGDALSYGYIKADKLPKIFYDFEANKCDPFNNIIPKNFLDNCLRGFIAESAEAGEISFKYSLTANMFQELSDWADNELYARLDREKGEEWHNILQGAINFLAEFNECQLYKIAEYGSRKLDPILTLVLATDKEIVYLSQLNKSRRLDALRSLPSLNFMKLQKCLPEGDIDLFDRTTILKKDFKVHADAGVVVE